MHMDHSPRRLSPKRKQDHVDLDDDPSKSPVLPKRPRLDVATKNIPIRHVDDIALLPLKLPSVDSPISLETCHNLHIPSIQPYISRQTLKELDLDIILRNPQLRHDLLFDYGLQFRPTSSRRKRQVADAYWNAVIREIESGCTCFPLVKHGNPLPIHADICVCRNSPPPKTPVVVAGPSSQITIVRTPSRIRPLLSEFLEVVLLVIQPLQSISSMYVNPDSFKTQMEEHSIQANHIRFIFDPALIEQQLKHDVFDLASLLRLIGATLKGHCAPMRDQAVEAMVQSAEACKPGGRGTKGDAVNAVRACMDILELMKLDIANHQLQTIRASMARTSANYELSSFRSVKASKAEISSQTCPITSQWLSQAWTCLHRRTSRIAHPMYRSEGGIDFSTLGKNRQVYLAALKGVTELAFYPPFLRPASSAVSPLFPASLADYPETMYLDHSRLKNLTKEIGDVVAVYMLLLLYRQLLFSSEWSDCASSSSSPRPNIKVDDKDLAGLKNEIQAIGSARLYSGKSSSSSDTVRRYVKEDMVLQVVMRAQEARRRAGLGLPEGTSPSSSLFSRPLIPSKPSIPRLQTSFASPPPSTPCTPVQPWPSLSSFRISSTPISTSASTSRATSPSPSSRIELVIPSAVPSPSSSSPLSPLKSSAPSAASSYFPPSPDPRILSVAQRWAEENMNISSPLGAVVYHRLHDSVFNAVVAQTYPGRNPTNATKKLESQSDSSGDTSADLGVASGMEPLAEEIRSLVDKISKLALIHLNVYLPVYESEGFVSMKTA